MSDPAAPFHTAQEAALRASNALAVAMGLAWPRIYTGVAPTAAPLPHIVIGDDQVLDDSDECQDGSEIYSTVHIWTKPNPPQAQQARQIAAVVRGILNAPLTITGHTVILYSFDDARFLTDPDGSTHAVLTFRYSTTPN